MTTIAKKKKISFIDLIRPHEIFSIDERFEIYRWMARTGQKYYKPKVASRGYPSYGHEAIALLSRSSAHGYGLLPERLKSDWEDELKLRFQHVLLSKYAQSEAIRWKQENSIDINSTKVLPIRYYAGEWLSYPVGMDLLHLLKAIFGFKGLKLKEQYNSFHPKADTILDISIGICPDYNLCIHYGYEEEFGNRCASSWPKDLPVVKDELFWDFVCRNYLLLKDMISPDKP
jgi:hypothetical protein